MAHGSGTDGHRDPSAKDVVDALTFGDVLLQILSQTVYPPEVIFPLTTHSQDRTCKSRLHYQLCKGLHFQCA